MNDRIRELLQQVGTDVSGKWISVDNAEKLAELIVRECADIGQRYADGNYEVPNQILEHFGVAEREE